MATRTYDAHASTDLTNVGAYAGGVVPLDGDTIDATVTTAPAVPITAAGTYHVKYSAGLGAFNPALFVAAPAILGTVTLAPSGRATLPAAITCTGLVYSSGLLACASPSTTITVGAGGVAAAAPEGWTGALKIAFTVDAGFWFTDTGATHLYAPRLIIPAGVTVTQGNAGSICSGLTIAATGVYTNSGNDQSLSIYPDADDAAFQNAGAMDFAVLIMGLDRMTGNYTQTTPLGTLTFAGTAGSRAVRFGQSTTTGHRTWTFATDFNIGTVPITSIHSLDAVACSMGLVMAAGANLTCGTITLGYESGAPNVRCGRLTLNAGTHTIGALAVDANSAAGASHQVNYGGRVEASGTQLWAYASVDLGHGAIIAADDILIDAADVLALDHTGAWLVSTPTKTLTIDNLPALATPIAAWGGCEDGGSNAEGSVVFHDSDPSDLCALGVGD
jgi:hypothetical protein